MVQYLELWIFLFKVLLGLRMSRGKSIFLMLFLMYYLVLHITPGDSQLKKKSQFITEGLGMRHI